MPKGAEVNLRTLCWYWGAAERGRGVQQHATYLILPESFTANSHSAPLGWRSTYFPGGIFPTHSTPQQCYVVIA